ncbi:hypothetical protein HA466_0063380 [Hirschfeldia incana]|nr:hypothetical protein HA466_0063380 [Hirschfeldia incana]
MSPSHLLAAVHLIFLVTTFSVPTASTAPLDTAASSAPHVITGSVNYGYPQAFKMKSPAGVPHLLLETLPFVKLVIRASNGIDETRSSSGIFSSPPTSYVAVSDEFRSLLRPSRVTLCSAVDSYSDEIGIRVTSPITPTSFVCASDELCTFPRPLRVALCSAVDSYSDESGIRVTPPTTPLYTVAISPRAFRHSEMHTGKCCRSRVGTPPPSPTVVTLKTLISYSENITRAWAYTSRMGLILNQIALCEVGLCLCLCFVSKDAVLLTIMCEVLLRQPLHTPPHCQEIYASSEMGCNCSQNPLIGFFKVVFDVCAFFQTQALGLQVKLFYGCFLSLATSIICFILVIVLAFVFHCNLLSPPGR